MLDKQIETIIDRLTERTISRRESITLKEIVAADIPRGVKAFIRATVIHWLKNDIAAAPRFAHVNRNAPGTRELTDAFLRSLGNAYQFTRTEYITILDDAVHFVANYLTRPRWTLENFIFEHSQTVSVDELLTRLDYTVDYAYFKRLIEPLMRQWGWRDVTARDFRTLVAKVDSQIMKQHSAREMGLLTKPMYDFLAMGDASRNTAIPLEPILLFFEDKNMLSMRDHIRATCDIRGRSELTLNELTALIEDLYLRHPQTHEPSIVPDAGPPREGGSQPPADADIERAARSVPTQEQTAEPGPAPAPQGLPDLASLIGSKRRNTFIRKIFGKDRESYDRLIKELNGLSSWRAASARLTEFYTAGNLDPFSDVVVEFTDIVQSRFGEGPDTGTS